MPPKGSRRGAAAVAGAAVAQPTAAAAASPRKTRQARALPPLPPPQQQPARATHASKRARGGLGSPRGCQPAETMRTIEEDEADAPDHGATVLQRKLAAIEKECEMRKLHMGLKTREWARDYAQGLWQPSISKDGQRVGLSAGVLFV
eukprot:94898-Chlamydomonas_euryale.AAC.4